MFGAVWEPLGTVLKASGTILKHIGTQVAPCDATRGSFESLVGTCLTLDDLFGAVLRPWWCIVGALV